MTASGDPPRRIGWYHGWSIVAICMLTELAVNGMPVNAFSLFLRDWSADLHSPISTLQLGMAATSLGTAILSPFAGALADKYPARRILGGGLFVILLFCLGISFVTATWQFLVLYAVMIPVGLSLGATVPVNAIVSRWFVRRLGLALGLTAFGLGLAGVVLPPIVATVMPVIGWRMVWRGAAGLIAFVVLPLVLWAARERSVARDGAQYMTGGGAAHSHHHGGAGDRDRDGLTTLEILRRKNFWLLLAVFLPVAALYSACGQNFAPLATSHGVSQQTAGVLLSAYSLAHVASSLILGLLSDRFGNRLPLFGLALSTALGAVILAFGPGVASLDVGVLLVGFSGGIWTLLPATTAVEFGQNGVGRSLGLLLLFIPVLGAMPFVLAKIQEITGSYATGLSGLAVVTLVGGGACLFMRERHHGRATAAEKIAAMAKTVTPVV